MTENLNRQASHQLPEQDLRQQLQRTAELAGMDFFGVADLREESLFPQQSDPLIAAYSRAVSLATIFPPGSVAELQDGPSHTYVYHYRIVNALLDETALKISNQLTREGYPSYPIPASQRTSRKKLAGVFPHREAALGAGLGYRGRNNLILTPGFGSSVRLVSILTNAPLETNREPAPANCGDCTICIDNCPAKAIILTENGSSEFDAVECDQYQQWVRDRFGKRVCGKCIAFCPQTPKKN